ncbi:hypothetical protein HNP38_000586 [Chryseobacterium defluvii]|uniref:C1q domain-containing protein n=1 Tax=Chryseobacterium defluvii TaxID=160396 RepID=A0A840KC01_9FLAO|nr:hypothetical protein [Chryseobacterium defluvii]MBB4805314.1 hypothetical protein [Chryseobacterium defluvii]
MKKKFIIYRLSAYILFFYTGNLTAQTGVLTLDPANPFHVDAAKDNGSTSTTKATNDVVVSSAGNFGVGVVAPVTKVDLRSSDQKGIIGIGANASQAASAAGGGAIRYNTATALLEYSDGEQWIPLVITAPAKALVNAYKSSSQSISNNTVTIITGWTETADTIIGNSGDFNASSGIFTAPRDGFYLVSFSITLATGTIPNNTFIETAIEAIGSGSDNIPVFKTVNSYPAFQAGSVSNYISGNCNAIFNLKATNTIRFTVKHNISSGRNVLNNGALNNISISEL